MPDIIDKDLEDSEDEDFKKALEDLEAFQKTLEKWEKDLDKKQNLEEKASRNLENNLKVVDNTSSDLLFEKLGTAFNAAQENGNYEACKTLLKGLKAEDYQNLRNKAGNRILDFAIMQDDMVLCSLVIQDYATKTQQSPALHHYIYSDEKIQRASLTQFLSPACSLSSIRALSSKLTEAQEELSETLTTSKTAFSNNVVKQATTDLGNTWENYRDNTNRTPKNDKLLQETFAANLRHLKSSESAASSKAASIINTLMKITAILGIGLIAMGIVGLVTKIKTGKVSFFFKEKTEAQEKIEGIEKTFEPPKIQK